MTMKWRIGVVLLAALVMVGCGEAGEDATAASAATAATAGQSGGIKAPALASALQPPSPESIGDKRGTEKLLGDTGLSGTVAHAPIDTLVDAFRRMGRTDIKPVSDVNHLRVPWAPWMDGRNAVVLVQFKGQGWTEVISPQLNGEELSKSINARVIHVNDSGWSTSYVMWASGKKIESFHGNGTMPFREAAASEFETPQFFSAYRDVDFKTIKMTDGQFINDFVKTQGAYMGLCTMQPDYIGDRDDRGRPGVKLTWPHERFAPGLVEAAYLLQ